MSTKNLLLALATDASNYTKGMALAKTATEQNKKELEKWAAQNKKAETSAAYLSQRLKMDKEQQATYGKQIEITKASIAELSKDYDKNAKAIEKMRTSLLSAETAQAKLNNQIAKTPSQVWAARGEALSAVGSKMQSAGMQGTMFITAPIIAAAAGLSVLAANAIETENLFKVSMANMSVDATAWAKNFAGAMGRIKTEVEHNLGVFNIMFTSMSFGEDAAYSMSKGLTKLAYDLGSLYNVADDVAFDKLRSGIMGQERPLKELGFTITAETTKQYAWAHGIANTGKELTEQEKILARYGQLLTISSKAQGDLARTADDPINAMKKFKAELVNTGEVLGEAFMPTIRKTLSTLNNDAMPVIKSLVENFGKAPDSVKNTTIGVIGLAAALPPLIATLGSIAMITGGLFNPAGAFAMGAIILGGATLGIKAYNAVQQAQIQASINSATATAGEIGNVQKLYTEYTTLRDNTNKTTEEKAKLLTVTDELRQLSPKVASAMDGETISINNQKIAVQDLLKEKSKLLESAAITADVEYGGTYNKLDIARQKVSLLRLIDRSDPDKLTSNELAAIREQADKVMPDDHTSQWVNVKQKLADALIEENNITEQLTNMSKATNLWKDYQSGKILKGTAATAYDDPNAINWKKMMEGLPSAAGLDSGTKAASAEQTAMQNLANATQTYIDKIKSATESTMAFWDKLTPKSESVTSMIRNMAKNADIAWGMKNDLATLNAAGVDPAIIAQLSKGGLASSKTIHNLATKATGTAYADINRLYKEQSASSQQIAYNANGGRAGVVQYVKQVIINGKEISENALLDALYQVLEAHGVKLDPA